MNHISELFGEINASFEAKAEEPAQTSNDKVDVPEGNYLAQLIEITLNKQNRIVMKLNIIEGHYKNKWLWIFMPATGEHVNITKTAFWKLGVPLLNKAEQELMGKEPVDFATQLMNTLDYLNGAMPVIKIARKQIGDYTNNYIDGLWNPEPVQMKPSTKMSASDFAHEPYVGPETNPSAIDAPVIPRSPSISTSPIATTDGPMTVDKVKAIFNS